MKRELDQHFTDANEAYKLVLSLTERLDPAHARRYIEPSCGKGAFVEALRAIGVPRRRIRSVEIDPGLPADVHGDFLQSTRVRSASTAGNPTPRSLSAIRRLAAADDWHALS